MAQNKSEPIIFVVDDEPLLLELTKTFLEPCGWSVRTFPDAEMALPAFKSANPRPALVITDYAMHQMNGMDLVRECRKIEPKQKILLVSGTVDQSIYYNMPEKPNGFLAKPYQSRDLIALVKPLVEG